MSLRRALVDSFNYLLPFAVSCVLFLGPVYIARFYMISRGLPPPCPPGFVETGQGWCDWGRLNPLLFYDAVHYLAIAKEGYVPWAGEVWGRTCWYPLYPLLIRLLGSTPASAVAVSALSFLGAIAAAYYLGGKRAAWALALNPLGLLCFSAYSESLFLCLTGWTLFFLLKGRYGRAGFMAGLCALCRPVGWAVVAGGILEILRQKKIREAASFLLPAGLLGVLYPLFLWARFGSPSMAFQATSTLFGRCLTWPFLGLLQDGFRFLYMSPSDKLMVLVNLPFGLYFLSKALKGRFWFSLPYALLAISQGICRPGYVPSCHGLLRYAGGCFPWCLGIFTPVQMALNALLGMLVSWMLFQKWFIF
ncbi:MAG TPA: hypothetical protein ENM97_02345 [Moorella mulderi]|nr:hypothetical protein [Moorella mulderi]